MSLLSNIRYLSPSSIILFKNQPALWCVKYLYGVKDEAGPAAWRGTAVEAGVDWLVLNEADPANAEAAALANFDLNAQGEISDEIEKERANVPLILKAASPAMLAHGKPLARQVKVETYLDGISIPVIGFLDYDYADKLVDLKTTLRMPKEPRPDHAAQVALYAQARQKRPILVYATPRQCTEFAVNSHEDAIKDLTRSARALCAALDSFDDQERMSRVFAPDFNSFYWNDKTKNAAMEIWQ